MILYLFKRKKKKVQTTEEYRTKNGSQGRRTIAASKIVNGLAILFQLCTKKFAIMCSAVYSTRTIT